MKQFKTLRLNNNTKRTLWYPSQYYLDYRRLTLITQHHQECG